MSSPGFSEEMQGPSPVPTFRPARPWGWVLWLVQNFIRLDLFLHNKLSPERRNLELLRQLPREMGIILTVNHADETDFKVCLELARLSGTPISLYGKQ